MIKTRIAPSPTGYLHLGTARTALFNWLYAKHTHGKYYIRVEDTDTERSTQEAVEIIFKSLEWLGLESEDPAVFQSQNQARHLDVAQALHQKGQAYYCTCTVDELNKKRQEAKEKGLPLKYDGTCRNQNHTHGALRFKMPQEGNTSFQDAVQGTVTVENDQFEDFVIARANNTPTYMLAVVVDDHDMEITHIIRGDDHLTNTFKQLHLYQAMGWNLPTFAHVPLIHGQDGGKFSKRHGAPAVTDYKEMGILPEALFNYLLRLGWSHGNQELFTREEAVKLFDLPALNKAAARFDRAKLLSVNAHYLKEKSATDLLAVATPFLTALLQRSLEPLEQERLLKGLTGLATRSHTLVELAEAALIYCNTPFNPNEEASSILTEEAKKILGLFQSTLLSLSNWDKETLDRVLKSFLEDQNLKMPALGKPLRVALTGQLKAPGLSEILFVLGKDEALKRLKETQ